MHWNCGLSPDLRRLHCEAGPEADGPAARAASDALEVTPNAATGRGVSCPLDPRRRWVIDLWSVSSDPEFVRLRARSVAVLAPRGLHAAIDGPVVLEPLQQTAAASRW